MSDASMKPSALAEHASQRTAKCISAVRNGVRVLRSRGEAVTVASVARAAGVSRNFIYTTPQALEIVDRARRERPRTLASSGKASSGGSQESLQTRLIAALDEIERLKSEMSSLKAHNTELIEAIVNLQNPPIKENVTQLRRRRF
ncbi:DUF6262 family protein [Arthrobacter sp. USHLN218]|uniref:DUF6262 family protein n=1 Tax=Arthrobacter sp. USHLN218 TaxID=3081232 RepID=UPI00301B41BC